MVLCFSFPSHGLISQPAGLISSSSSQLGLGLALKCTWEKANSRTQKGHARSARLSAQVSRFRAKFVPPEDPSLRGPSLSKEADPEVSTFQSTFTMLCSFLRRFFYTPSSYIYFVMQPATLAPPQKTLMKP